MLKQLNFFYSQPSTLRKEALAKFYPSATFGLSVMIRPVAPTGSSTFYTYQSASKHGRRTFPNGAMRELVSTGNFGQKRLKGSYSESIFQQQFGEYHSDDGCCSIYFDSSTIVKLSGSL